MRGKGEEKLDFRKLAIRCANIAKKKKALNVLVFDIRKLTPFVDYLVICSGQSVIQVKAISEAVEMALKKEKISLCHREGIKFAHWILLDYGGVVIHIFHEETRKFYNLDKIWGDGTKVKWERAKVEKKRKGSAKRRN